ncbi:MAG: type I-E CRISPR-associated protein Cse2/CasB [Methylococcaceae bacterium]|nr:type I-E CRISPR-associated protein Cse2/CasB [Methylococcaceae bacterium]
MSQYYFFKYEDIQAIQQWHKGLDENRGDRARLRRADSHEDILLTEAFFHFLQKMPDSGVWREDLAVSACVAGALSQVKIDRQTASRIYNKKDSNKPNVIASFAEQLATPSEAKGKAAMSELRFQQLQKSPSTEDFYRRIIRAIQLLKGQVNIVSLAHDIIQWHKEFEHPVSHSATNRLAVRWATDYFTALAKIKS